MRIRASVMGGDKQGRGGATDSGLCSPDGPGRPTRRGFCPARSAARPGASGGPRAICRSCANSFPFLVGFRNTAGRCRHVAFRREYPSSPALPRARWEGGTGLGGVL